MIQNTRMEQLLARFADGQTSEAEEQFLSEYFRTAENVPEEWKAYQEMFASFDADAYDFDEAELDNMCQPMNMEDDMDDVADMPKRNPFARWRMCAAAAVMAGIVGSAAYFMMAGDSHTDSVSVDVPKIANNATSQHDQMAVSPKERPVAKVIDEPIAMVASAEKNIVHAVLEPHDVQHASVSKQTDACGETRMRGDTCVVDERASVPVLSVVVPDFDQIMADVREMNGHVASSVVMVYEIASYEGDKDSAAEKYEEIEERNSLGASCVGAEDAIEVPSLPRMQ